MMMGGVLWIVEVDRGGELEAEEFWNETQALCHLGLEIVNGATFAIIRCRAATRDEMKKHYGEMYQEVEG